MSLKKRGPKQEGKISKKLFNFRLTQNDLIGAIFFVAFVVSSVLVYQFEERFDTEKWKTRPFSRSEMVYDIIDKELFINTSKKHVIDELGKPNEINTEEIDAFYYYTGLQPSFTDQKLTELVLVFKNNKVATVYLQPRRNL